MNGKHYPDVLAGRVFSQSSSPLGLALPLYTATAATGGSLPIWNPPNSGVYVEVISINCERASGTMDFGAIGLMAGPLQAIATASGCSAFANTQPVSALTGLASGGSKVTSSNAGTVTVTAGTAAAAVPGVAGAGWFRTLFCFNLEADTGTAHANAICEKVFDGDLIIPPGVLMYIAATKATGGLVASTIVWKEMPITALR